MKKKRKKKFPYIPVLTVALAAIGCSALLGHTVSGAQSSESAQVSGSGRASVTASSSTGGTIEKNVYIGPVNVGGMTMEEAKEAVDAYIQEVEEGTTTLEGTIGSQKVSNSDLGITIDAADALKQAADVGKCGNLVSRYKQVSDCANSREVFEPDVQVDMDKASTVFKMYQDQLVQAPVDYGLKRDNGTFTVTGGTPGTEVDASGTAQTIQDYYASASGDASGDVTVATKDAQPQGSKEELSKVTDVLGTYSTNYSSSTAGRKANIARATELLNGTVVYPGDMVSVYAITGPLTAENGYELAGAYENGTTVQDYGGGICQVSSTLYNAVLYSELEVDERNNHSMIVSYVEPSRDAAIAGGVLDFKFSNNTDAPIYIEGTADGSTVTYTIYGQDTREAGRTIDFQSVITGTEDAPDTTTYITDDNLALGTIQLSQQPHQGTTAELWKYVYENGTQVSKQQINSSVYKPAGTVYSVGTKSDDADAVATVKAAVKTQDADTINQAVQQVLYGN